MSAPAAVVRRRITILHYSAPPVVGGVESTIYHHARLLAQVGYEVHIIAGVGGAFHPQVAFHLLPEVNSRHSEVLAVKRELDRGQVSDRFYRLRDHIAELLRPYLTATDVLIVHNVLTLHKNLSLTAALYGLLVKEPRHIRALAWHHDLAWRDSQYISEVHPGYPWDLLRRCWPKVVHVTVSYPRQRDVAALYEIAPEAVVVVPPGMDLSAFFRWSEVTQRVIQAYRLLDADLVLLLPVRITRRKNIQLAVRTLAILRQKTELDARLVVTGGLGPHNPSNAAYLKELMALRRKLGLTTAVHFVCELSDGESPLVPEGETMFDFYSLADALLFPSLEEGFGIPMLEAGLARVPVFCSDIPALRATGGQEAHYFAPDADPEAVAELIAQHLLADHTFRLRHRVKEYQWEHIVRTLVIPLLEGNLEER